MADPPAGLKSVESVTPELAAADAAQLAGRWAEAEAVYRRLLSARPDHAEALAGLGRLALTMDQAPAHHLLRLAAAADPALPAAWDGLFQLWRAEFRDARWRAIRRLTTLEPEVLDHWLARAGQSAQAARAALMLAPDQPAALALSPLTDKFARLIRLAPGVALGWRGLAQADGRAEGVGTAQAARIALALTPDDAGSLLLVGNQARAPHWQRRALAVDPAAGDALDLGDDLPIRRAAPTATGKRLLVVTDTGFAPGAGSGHGSFGRAALLAGHHVATLALVRRRNDHPTVDAVLAAIAASRPDAVLLGNLHGARVRTELLEAIGRRWPTGFVLHDLWAMTGRCTYPGSCTRFREDGCDTTCPTARDYPFLPAAEIRDEWSAKRRLFAAGTVALGAASRYFASSAATGLGLPATTIATLRYGFDRAIFRPRDRTLARRILGWPDDGHILLCGAAILSEPRKGVDLLAGALARLARPGLRTMFVGTGTPTGDRRGGPLEKALFMGFQPSAQVMALAYAAADLFVGPSIDEGLGQTFIEAAACGTPSIGFPVGGVPEAIAPGITGWLAPAVQVDALADTIAAALDDPSGRQAISMTAPRWVADHWSFAGSYRSLEAAFGRHFGLPPLPELSVDNPPPLPRPSYVVD